MRLVEREVKVPSVIFSSALLAETASFLGSEWRNILFDFESEEETDSEKLTDIENPRLGSESEQGFRKQVDGDCNVGFGMAAIKEKDEERLKASERETEERN